MNPSFVVDAVPVQTDDGGGSHRARDGADFPSDSAALLRGRADGGGEGPLVEVAVAGDDDGEQRATHDLVGDLELAARADHDLIDEQLRDLRVPTSV